MAHKTMVDGVAYEITGGKTLVNGTGYAIKSGKTLVGGTAYEVGFGKPIPIITITGDDADGYSYTSVTINGITYTSRRYDGTTVSVEVEAGTVISCSAFCPSAATSATLTSTYISVNGTKVKTATGIPSDISYDYVVTGNANIRLRSREKYSNIAITEE